MAEIPTSSYWRHHNGKPYYVIGIVQHSDDARAMVLYKGTDSQVWILETEKFIELFTFLGPQPNDWGLIKPNG